jgi:hypothetical protein
MIDETSLPQNLDDTQASLNPYSVPAKIWNHLEEYFKTKYNVEYVDAYPQQQVIRPTITWGTAQRNPGSNDGKAHSRGENFTSFLPNTPDGLSVEVYTQQHTAIYEFIVFAISTAQTEQIAWDLERAIVETTGIIQAECPGFQLVFEQQSADSSMLWRQSDDMIKRTIRFKGIIPVRFTRLVPEMRFIQFQERWGSTTTYGEFIRGSSESIQYIPTDVTVQVTNISRVYILSNNSWVPLEISKDYILRKDSNQITYLEWQDKYGRTPSVGTQWAADYEIAAFIGSRNIRK